MFILEFFREIDFNIHPVFHHKNFVKFHEILVKYKNINQFHVFKNLLTTTIAEVIPNKLSFFDTVGNEV